MLNPSMAWIPKFATARSRRGRHRLRLAVGGAALTLLAVAGCGQSTGEQTSGHSNRVASAAQVMAFDLNATTHSFTKTADGGVERVVANSPSDDRNIASIRDHLQKEQVQFSAGNFSDPAAIHGSTMPGLADLKAGASRIRVTYVEVPAGAQLVYGSAEPGLVSALHAWFDAQSSDHNVPGMGMGH